VTSACWSLILAGGAGRRLREITGDVPKQFWSPDGHRTLVERTVERVLALVPPEHITTVIGPGQERHADRLTEPGVLGHLVVQTTDRGTGAAVLLGLTDILGRADDPVVLITPADHAVGGTAEFQTGIRFAVHAVEHARCRAVLFGVVATEPVTDYGWIVPGHPAGGRGWLLRPVRAFVEKPEPAAALRLLMTGALWNTMVLVARARTVLQMIAAACTDAAGTRVPHLDFSRHVIAAACGLSVYTWPDTLEWTDLGTPNRLRQWQKAS